MTAHIEHPFSWVRRVDSALRQLDLIPLCGKSPPFDTHRISSLIASHFNTDSLIVELRECAWREASAITKGLGPGRIALGITIAPLEGQVVWLMSREDVSHLTSQLMAAGRKQAISSEILQEGFYRYLALNTLDALQALEPLKDFTLRLDEEAADGGESSYCLDIKIAIEEKTIWGRLVLSHVLLSSWQRYFASSNEIVSLTPFAKGIECSVGVRVGSVMMSTKELKSLRQGDFVLLDRGSYDPRKNTGIVSLTVGTIPLFHASVKENKIKLLDYALVYEEDMNERDTGPQEIGAEEGLSADERKIMAVKDLPLFVTVELARLRMSVEQLMKLSPGNFLELPISPDQGATLSVNGQSVGRAEVVYLGESLGLRILETIER